MSSDQLMCLALWAGPVTAIVGLLSLFFLLLGLNWLFKGSVGAQAHRAAYLCVIFGLVILLLSISCTLALRIVDIIGKVP